MNGAGDPSTGGAAQPRAPLFGRDRELAIIDDVVGKASAGMTQIVVVSGAPGAGKTRLAEEAAARAARSGAIVTWGRAWEGGGASAYWPWSQALRALVRAVPDARWPFSPPELVALVPELASTGHPPSVAVTASEADVARLRLFDSVSELLSSASSSAPVCVILEDLHAADVPSVLMLQFLSRTLREVPLLVLGTLRAGQSRSRRDLSLLLDDLSCDATIGLAGLDEEDTGRVIEAISGSPPDAATLRAVFEATEGHPFFVTEIARLLAAASPEDAGSVPLPDSVRQAVRRRVHALAAATRQALTLASVIGVEFDARVLALAAEPEGHTVRLALEDAERAGLVVRIPSLPGSYRFGHALVREVLYEDLSEVERNRLHGAVGEALDELGDDDDTLDQRAHHFFRAAAAHLDDRALAYSRRAAERAAARLAYEEAAGHYEHALLVMRRSALPDDGARRDLLIRLAETQTRAGRVEEARAAAGKAAQLARECADAEQLARAAMAPVEPWPRPGAVDQALVGTLREALAALAPEDGAVRALALGRLAAELHWSGATEPKGTLSAEAVAMARRLGDRSALAQALIVRLYVLTGWGDPQERIAVAGEAERLAEESGDLERSLQARLWRIPARLDAGDRAGLDRDVAAYAAGAAELRQPLYDAQLSAVLAMVAMLDGRFDEAERRATAGLEIAGRLRGEAAAFAHAAQMAVLRQLQGRLPELEPLLLAVVERAPHVPAPWATLAAIYVQTGRPADARQAVARLLAQRGRADFPPDHGRFPALATAVDLAVALADRQWAAALHETLEPHADRAGSSSHLAYLGSVSQLLGALDELLGRRDTALERFESALEAHRAMAARPWVARSLVASARLLSRRAGHGDRSLARERAAEALSLAREIGMPDVERDASALLPARAGPARGPNVLTRREQEIADLVAEGLTNRAIADRLVVSVRTVDAHVEHIRGKLGVRSRVQIAAWVRAGAASPSRD